MLYTAAHGAMLKQRQPSSCQALVHARPAFHTADKDIADQLLRQNRRVLLGNRPARLCMPDLSDGNDTRYDKDAYDVRCLCNSAGYDGQQLLSSFLHRSEEGLLAAHAPPWQLHCQTLSVILAAPIL